MQSVRHEFKNPHGHTLPIDAIKPGRRYAIKLHSVHTEEAGGVEPTLVFTYVLTGAPAR